MCLWIAVRNQASERVNMEPRRNRFGKRAIKSMWRTWLRSGDGLAATSDMGIGYDLKAHLWEAYAAGMEIALKLTDEKEKTNR